MITKIICKVIKLIYSRKNPIGYARRIGVSIGEQCKIVKSPNWGSEPYLISIGNRTEISFDCVFITHDGATWVFREEERYKNVVKFGRIKIGSNCFIGARTTILPSVTIGDNSVIAAGSVVTKSIPAGEVWGGVPAHFILNVDEYAERCLKKTPQYNVINLKKNKKEEVLKIVDR